MQRLKSHNTSVFLLTGCAPYAGVASSELLPKLKAGHRLDKPRYCTDWL